MEVDGAALVDMMGAVVCCCLMVVTLGGVKVKVSKKEYLKGASSKWLLKLKNSTHSRHRDQKHSRLFFTIHTIPPLIITVLFLAS